MLTLRSIADLDAEVEEHEASQLQEAEELGPPTNGTLPNPFAPHE